MSAPTSTYNLSQLYRALGMRDARVIPELPAGVILPVISLGNFNSFAAEQIEAREITNGGPFTVPPGQWFAHAMLSVAPGGTVIEALACNGPFGVNLAPVRPFIGINVSPFRVGGQTSQNLFESLPAFVVLPAPVGGLLGGSNSPGSAWDSAAQIGGVLTGIWVPPGWWFWLTFFEAANVVFAWRCREIPEAQGPA